MHLRSIITGATALALLAGLVPAFRILENQASGVYLAYYEEHEGTKREIHVRIDDDDDDYEADATAPLPRSDLDLTPAPDPGRLQKRYEIHCEPQNCQVRWSSFQVAYGKLRDHCGGGVDVPGDGAIYIKEKNTLAYYCNQGQGTHECSAAEATRAISTGVTNPGILYQCGYLAYDLAPQPHWQARCGWYEVTSVETYGFTLADRAGDHFCERIE